MPARDGTRRMLPAERNHLLMKKIKLCAVLLVLVLLTALTCGCKKDELAFQMDGVRLSVSDFRALYQGEKTLDECDSRTDALAAVSDVNITDQYLSFYMMTSCEKNYEICNFMGQLFADETLQKAGVPAAVAYIVDSADGLQSLLFQIYNSSEPDDTLLIHPELSGKPHMKVYMIDSSERMFFFEFELPDAFAGVTGEGLSATAVYDTWYQTFFENGAQMEG